MKFTSAATSLTALSTGVPLCSCFILINKRQLGTRAASFIFIFLIRACLHEGGGSQVGKVTRFGGVTRVFM